MEFLVSILILVVLYVLYKKTKDNKVSGSNKNIIYVLDSLHDFAVRDWEQKNIDHGLYKILNGPEVYQEAFHMGLFL